MHNDALTLTLRTQGRDMTWLARKLGMSRRTLYYRMRGEFTMDEQQRLEDILDIPKELLFGDAPGLRHAQRCEGETV